MEKIAHSIDILHKTHREISWFKCFLMISMTVLHQSILDESKRLESSEENFSSTSSKGEILSTAKGDVEYVNLLKISRNQYEDPCKLNIILKNKFFFNKTSFLLALQRSIRFFSCSR